MIEINAPRSHRNDFLLSEPLLLRHAIGHYYANIQEVRTLSRILLPYLNLPYPNSALVLFGDGTRYKHLTTFATNIEDIGYIPYIYEACSIMKLQRCLRLLLCSIFLKQLYCLVLIILVYHIRQRHLASPTMTIRGSDLPHCVHLLLGFQPLRTTMRESICRQ